MTRYAEVDLELLLRRIIREEAGVSAVVPADKWRGGMLVLRPGTGGLQEKSWPIETFFHKIVMLRNRLRTLEQVVNASDLTNDAKVKLEGYISGCYGSLTSFNVLFADEEDQFKGSGGDSRVGIRLHPAEWLRRLPQLSWVRITSPDRRRCNDRQRANGQRTRFHPDLIGKPASRHKLTRSALTEATPGAPSSQPPEAKLRN